MKAPKGIEVFNEFFAEIYGERWDAIFLSLKEDDKKVARRNLFFETTDKELLDFPGITGVNTESPNCFDLDDTFSLDEIDSQMLPFYRMDPASLAPALALEVNKGDQVLDMCAAPGGKTLLLIEAMTGVNEGSDVDLEGQITANELSPKRRHRMMSVMKRYLPKEVRSRVSITGTDGSKIGLHKKEVFDRILIDAPCSGERGLVHKPSELAMWKPKRSKSFGIRQYALLASAFMALKPGGRIVYSTCSLSPFENDEVVAKLIKRQGSEQVKILSVDQYKNADLTEYGQQFLPDKKGWGPIYFSVIEKS